MLIVSKRAIGSLKSNFDAEKGGFEMGWTKELIKLRKAIDAQAISLEIQLAEKLPKKFTTLWVLEGENLVRRNLLERGCIMNYIITDPSRLGFKSLQSLKSVFLKILQPAWKDFVKIHAEIKNNLLIIDFTAI